MVVSLVCTASLGLLGHPVEMVVMAVKRSKVTRAARERLEPGDLQELMGSKLTMKSMHLISLHFWTYLLVRTMETLI